MTNAVKHSSTVSTRYAVALLDLAQNSKNLNKITKDLKSLKDMEESSTDFALLLHSPLLSKQQKEKGIMALAKKAKLEEMTCNFLGVLTRNGRLNLLGAVIKAFEEEQARRRGEITVGIEIAQDMSKKQKDELQKALSKAIGSDVLLDLEVKPDILGGMIVTIGSQRIDDSIARKLERLHMAMTRQSNENQSGTDLKTA